MKRTTAVNSVDNLYVDEIRSATGITQNGTSLIAEDRNNIQEEICNVIEGAGIELDGGDESQLFKAIRSFNDPPLDFNSSPFTPYNPTTPTNAPLLENTIHINDLHNKHCEFTINIIVNDGNDYSHEVLIQTTGIQDSTRFYLDIHIKSNISNGTSQSAISQAICRFNIFNINFLDLRFSQGHDYHEIQQNISIQGWYIFKDGFFLKT